MKEKKEKKLINYSTDDKKSFIQLLITTGAVAAFNSFLIPLMFHLNTPNYFFMGTLLSIASLGVIAETLRNNFEEIRNYVYSRKYKNKYYNEMESKIDKVQDYIFKAEKSYDLYFNLKNNTATPANFLEKIKIEAFESALQAKMIANIHQYNLTKNEKYFNDMILHKQYTTLDVTTLPSYFDLPQDKANQYFAKYKELEEQIKDNCDVRNIDLTNLNKTTKIEKETILQTKDVIINNNNNNNNNNNKQTYKSKDKEFEQ